MKDFTVGDIKSGDVIEERFGAATVTLYACQAAQPYVEADVRTGWTCIVRRSNDPGDTVRLLAIDAYPHYAPKLRLLERNEGRFGDGGER
jgi:hypothetical protein